MIFINPQWQGSGVTNQLQYGAETFEAYFKESDKMIVRLSDQDLKTQNHIIGFEPILEQTIRFKEIIMDCEPDKITTLGGDCGIEIIPISYLNKKYDHDFCILWIDAHADLNTPESSPSQTFHGMPLRTLLGDGNPQIKDLLISQIQPHQICFIGLRDLDQPESEYILKNQITSLADCQYQPIYEKIKVFKYIYIHLDLDVLDKSEYAHTLFPTSHGLLVHEVAELITKLKSDHQVVGFCITESTATKLVELKPIQPILDKIDI